MICCRWLTNAILYQLFSCYRVLLSSFHNNVSNIGFCGSNFSVTEKKARKRGTDRFTWETEDGLSYVTAEVDSVNAAYIQTIIVRFSAKKGKGARLEVLVTAGEDVKMSYVHEYILPYDLFLKIKCELEKVKSYSDLKRTIQRIIRELGKPV